MENQEHFQQREEPMHDNVIQFPAGQEGTTHDRPLPSEKEPPPFLGTDPGLNRALEIRAEKDIERGAIGS